MIIYPQFRQRYRTPSVHFIELECYSCPSHAKMDLQCYYLALVRNHPKIRLVTIWISVVPHAVVQAITKRMFDWARTKSKKNAERSILLLSFEPLKYVTTAVQSELAPPEYCDTRSEESGALATVEACSSPGNPCYCLLSVTVACVLTPTPSIPKTPHTC